jgi:cyclopropane fatty-acyl-phospholipid synthase-like methyltransferase
MTEYWDKRFLAEGKIWGESPSRTATHALEIFQSNAVRKVLVPGSGYGRNTKVFSTSGFGVTGIEISPIACEIAHEFDPFSRHYNTSVLDMSCLDDTYDAVYGFNILHLFHENDRKLFIDNCLEKLNANGLMFFTVFSEKEASYGKGREVEKDTFESKPGRPVHYFTENDLREQSAKFDIIETGLAEDTENHVEEGSHKHVLRYICVRLK